MIELGGLSFFEDSEDQTRLLELALAQEDLSESHTRCVVWSAVMSSRDSDLLGLAKQVADG